jgi:hypothetical protein
VAHVPLTHDERGTVGADHLARGGAHDGPDLLDIARLR